MAAKINGHRYGTIIASLSPYVYLPNKLLSRLQSVVNSAARSDHITDTLHGQFSLATCFWAYRLQSSNWQSRLASSARHSTQVSRWRTVQCRWLDEMSSPVVDLQSAGCPTVTPSYCWRPFICHSCMSQHLERSSWRCRVCHIFTNISAKTENTNIYFDNLTRTLGYFVTVSIIHHSGPCCFLLRPLYTSPQWPILCRLGRKPQLNQSLNQLSL